MIKTSRIESFFEEGKPFADLLPYFNYENGFFVLKDGSLGQVWQLTLLEAETKSALYLEELSRMIEGILIRLPEEKVSCQFILFSDSDFDDRLDEYMRITSPYGNNIVNNCVKSRLEHLKKGRDGFFDTHTGIFSAKRIRVFFTMRYFSPYLEASAKDKIQSYFTPKNLIREKISDSFAMNFQSISRFSAIVEGVFRSCEIKFSKIGEEGLFRILYKIFNPKRAKVLPIPTFRTEEPIIDQILYNDPKANGVGFEFEEELYRVVTLKELPLSTEAGMFSAELTKGTRFSMLDLIKDFIMVVNFYIPNQEEAVSRIKMHKAFAFMQRANLFGDKQVEAIEKKEELDTVIKETFSQGHKIVYPRIHFIVSGSDPRNIENSTSGILNTLSRMGAEGLKEEAISASLFLSCLPLCFDQYYETFIKRTKRMISNNLSDMFPLYGSVKGTRTPAQMYLNRRGETVFWDFFDSNTNPHAIVIGASGSG